MIVNDTVQKTIDASINDVFYEWATDLATYMFIFFIITLSFLVLWKLIRGRK